MQQNEVVDFQKFRDGETGPNQTENAAQHFLPAGTTLLLRQYTIEGYLNCGGFGITYIARDSLNRKIVIKECFPGEMVYRKGKAMVSRSPRYDDELASIVRHFVTEAHSLANLKHENIVHVHQIFEENQTAYLAMDFIDGPDLLDLLDSNRKLSPKQVQKLTRTMLDAIGYVHRMGMLHRDISPDNILVEKSGKPVLIDFGAARLHVQLAQAALTRMKFVKDGYSPQEFYIAGAEQGTFSDLYAFAASMYHLITGEAPVDSQTRLAARAAKKPDPYVPLNGNVAGYPLRFLNAIDTALSVMPSDRLQTAEEWLQRITPVSSTPAIISRPATVVMESLSVFEDLPMSGTIAKWRKDKPLLAAGVAGLALLAGAGVIAMQFGGDTPSLAEGELAAASSAPSIELAEVPRFAGVAEQDDISLNGPRDQLAAGSTTGAADDAGAIPSVLAVAPTVDEVPASPETAVASGDGPVVASVGPSRPVPGQVALSSDAPLDALRKADSELRVAGKADTGARPTLLADAVISLAPAIPFTSVGKVEPPLGSTERDAVVRLPALIGIDRPERIATLSTPTDLSFLPTVPSQPEPLAELRVAPSAEDTGDAFARLVGAPPAAANKDTATSRQIVPGDARVSQISYSYWDIAMPFRSELRVDNGVTTAVITEVSPDANLATSGAWIAEGAILTEFNGDPLRDGTPVSTQVLDAMSMDPDGYTRVSVGYRDAVNGFMGKGELAVPVVRKIGLTDGTVFETRKEGPSWFTSVKTLGSADTDLQVGDILMGETVTDRWFDGHESFEATLNDLAALGLERADFTILRGGQRDVASWDVPGE